MTKEQKIYCKIGQAVCKVIGATMFFAMLIMPCVLAGYITNLI